MPRVKAISNFADGSHAQGDVFDLSDEDAKRFIAVEAVELVADDTTVTEQAAPATAPVTATPQPQPVQAAQGQPTVAAPLATTSTEPSVQSGTSVSQPTPEQISQDIQAVENPNTTQI